MQFSMAANDQTGGTVAANPFASADILAILRERGWLTADPKREIDAWCGYAAAILGPQAALSHAACACRAPRRRITRPRHPVTGRSGRTAFCRARQVSPHAHP